MLLSKAIEGYLLEISAKYSHETLRLYRPTLRIIQEVIGDRELEAITPQMLTSFMVYLRSEHQPRRLHPSDRPLSPSTIDNYWKCIRSFFGWCNQVLNLPRPDNNLPRPRYRLPDVKSFSHEEINKILNVCNWTVEISPHGVRPYRRKRKTAHRDQALILFLLDTGLRIGELCRLKVEDVDAGTGEVVVAPYGTGQKTKPRVVYLGTATKRALWVYLAKSTLSPGDPLFSSKPKYLRGLIRLLGTRAGVTNTHPHRFRHTFAIEYLRNGGDPFTLQRLLGHSTLEMVRHYLNIIDADSKAKHSKASPVDNWRL